MDVKNHVVAICCDCGLSLPDGGSGRLVEGEKTVEMEITTNGKLADGSDERLSSSIVSLSTVWVTSEQL